MNSDGVLRGLEAAIEKLYQNGLRQIDRKAKALEREIARTFTSGSKAARKKLLARLEEQFGHVKEARRLFPALRKLIQKRRAR